MITARNYAAQAENYILSSNDAFTQMLDADELKRWHCYGGWINKSVHFAIPDGGKILANGGESMIGQNLKLPFPKITIEWVANGGKYLAIAVETPDGIIISGLRFFNKVLPIWTPAPTAAWITDGIPEKGAMVVAAHLTMFPTLKKLTEDQGVEAETLIDYFLGAVVELCEALLCCNVATANHQDSSPVNSKRIKFGKLPIYETKMLVIDTNYSAMGQEGRLVSHSSPRQHLRRGHIRRLPKGNIWVNSCVVGDASRGVINKSYAVI